MDETREDQERTEVYRLSDLQIDSIGLVRRGANRSPFYFIKSEDGGVSEMSDTTDKGREVPEVTRETALEALGLTEEVFAAFETFRAEGQEQEQLDEYAEMRQAIEEEFSAKLEAERQEREKVAEAFAEERKRRRMAEFTDQARGYAFAAEVEQFAEDLMALEDHDAELYSRWVKRLKALDEQVRQGGLFEQYSVAGGETEGGDPFERAVEKVRKERFSELAQAEGFVRAMEIVERDEPELARRYAETH